MIHKITFKQILIFVFAIAINGAIFGATNDLASEETVQTVVQNLETNFRARVLAFTGRSVSSHQSFIALNDTSSGIVLNFDALPRGLSARGALDLLNEIETTTIRETLHPERERIAENIIRSNAEAAVPLPENEIAMHADLAQRRFTNSVVRFLGETTIVDSAHPNRRIIRSINTAPNGDVSVQRLLPGSHFRENLGQ